MTTRCSLPRVVESATSTETVNKPMIAVKKARPIWAKHVFWLLLCVLFLIVCASNH